MLSQVTPEEVDRFLESTQFSGYQFVPLPHDRCVPGKSRVKTADVVFRQGVQNKSILDVGTYYGFFPNEAMRRGASYALGIEQDQGRYEIARRIAELHGGSYDIAHVNADDFEPHRRFDRVIVLNVLHHVLDPIGFISRLANFCSETMIVEFRHPTDPGYIEDIIKRAGRRRSWHQVLARLRSSILQMAGTGLPLMAVGNREYHRVFYFSPAAFYNIFVIHLAIFKNIEFVPSPGPGRRSIAFCQVVP